MSFTFIFLTPLYSEDTGYVCTAFSYWKRRTAFVTRDDLPRTNDDSYDDHDNTRVSG